MKVASDIVAQADTEKRGRDVDGKEREDRRQAQRQKIAEGVFLEARGKPLERPSRPCA